VSAAVSSQLKEYEDIPKYPAVDWPFLGQMPHFMGEGNDAWRNARESLRKVEKDA